LIADEEGKGQILWHEQCPHLENLIQWKNERSAPMDALGSDQLDSHSSFPK
jgi:hypothetical protein